MTRRSISALALVALAGLSGCKTMARQAFANPVVEVKDVQVRGVGAQGGSLDVILNVYNPNDYRLDATKITYIVWVDSSRVADGAIDKLVTLSQKGRSDITVPVNFTYESVRAALTQFMLRGSVDYRVTGNFTVVTPFGDITRPYSGAGRLDSFR